MSHTAVLVRARQLLTMVPGDIDVIREPPEPSQGFDAVYGRDRDITGLIEDGAVVLEGEKIAWVGPFTDLPARYEGVETYKADCVTPGFIDCHTHTPFGGSRHVEFTMRNLGADYLEILAAGGGIHSTTHSTAEMKRRALAELLVARCYEATRFGVTTLECKSGYGLAVDVELKQLNAINDARDDVLVDLVPTFLGAHAIPKKYRDRRADYVDLVCNEMIPLVVERGLAVCCDVFCDRGAFTAAEATRILTVGREAGLLPRIHADELSDAGAAQVAASVGAASADHLEFVNDEAIEAMASAGVVGVLLPGVNLYLSHTPKAPARKLISRGVDVALATDFNPGTSVTQDLGLIMTLGGAFLGMTPGECLLGVTRNAAKAIGRLSSIGTLEVGKRADLTMLSVDDFWQVPYVAGASHVDGVVRGGALVYWRSAEAIEG